MRSVSTLIYIINNLFYEFFKGGFLLTVFFPIFCIYHYWFDIRFRRVQREQLAAIFQLLQDNKETFGEVTETDMEDQLKLYSIWGSSLTMLFCVAIHRQTVLLFYLWA